MAHSEILQVTTCPHCATRFVIQSEELEEAFGAVRCGQCMKIFNARFHLSQEQLPTAEALTRTAQPTDSHLPLVADDIINPFDEEAELRAFEAELATALTDPDEIPADQEAQTQAAEPVPLMTEVRHAPPVDETQPRQTPAGSGLLKRFNRVHLLMGAAGLLLTLAVVTLLTLSQPAATSIYQVGEVTLSPLSNRSQLAVSLQLTNLTDKIQPLPDLQVDLLNISGQSVYSQRIAAADMTASSSTLAPGGSVALTLPMARPTTYVTAAQVIPLHP